MIGDEKVRGKTNGRSRSPNPSVKRVVDETGRRSLLYEGQSAHGRGRGDLSSKDNSLVDNIDVVALEKRKKRGQRASTDG